jgi:hypothetical protein
MKKKKKLKAKVLPLAVSERIKSKVCGTKNRYSTSELAASAVEMYGGSKFFKSYLCPCCSLWHNASKD